MIITHIDGGSDYMNSHFRIINILIHNSQMEIVHSQVIIKIYFTIQFIYIQWVVISISHSLSQFGMGSVLPRSGRRCRGL